ncbi:hypothetical protein AAVH_33483 [Aphelenchoides avenae]|nr:hypothetical protein AAVH_33483 [Aphelenchus avenae]
MFSKTVSSASPALGNAARTPLGTLMPSRKLTLPSPPIHDVVSELEFSNRSLERSQRSMGLRTGGYRSSGYVSDGQYTTISDVSSVNDLSSAAMSGGRGFILTRRGAAGPHVPKGQITVDFDG